MNKLDIALELLDAAIDERALHQRYFAAINLAGAADELFGRAIRFKNGSNRFDNDLNWMVPFYKHLAASKGWKEEKDEDIEKKFKKLFNLSKNNIKHMKNPKEDLDINEKEESNDAIFNAIINLKILGLPLSDSVKDFLDNYPWIYL